MGILRQIEALFLALEPISCNLSIQINTKNIKTFWSNLSIQIVLKFGQFEPQSSHKLGSYRKKCALIPA